MRIGIGTRWFINITILLTFDIPFVFYDKIVIEQEWPTSTLMRSWRDVDVTANNVEKKRSDGRYAQIRKCRRVDNRIDIWLTQISLNAVTDYKWIILYFII